MRCPFQQIECQWQGDVACIRLIRTQLDEHGLEELIKDIDQLIDEDGCKKLVLTLGPEDHFCLYSVFLAKLVNLQRRMATAGGTLALVQNGDEIELNVEERKLELRVPEDELSRRRQAWTPPPPMANGGYQRLYVEHVLQADKGADLDFLVGCRGADVPRESH